MSSPATTADPLERLLRESRVLWRGRELSRAPARTTGFAALDERLPGGGWPLGALIEIFCASEGLGELSLVIPLMRAFSIEKRAVALIAPPHIPYAPALVRAGIRLPSVVWIHPATDEDARWSAEQFLREGLGGAALLWSNPQSDRALRRLQLAAENGHAAAFLYRPISALARSSPAALRLALFPHNGGTRIELLKVRGARAGQLTLPLSAVNS
jgi:cell division inhibitor SulA